MWLDDVEEGALQQARNLANLPFVFRHIALMPDCHQGYGMPIGGVLAARGVIIPNAVGVDIGCGMCAVRSSLTGIDRNSLQRIVDRVHRTVPTGFHWHKSPLPEDVMPEREEHRKMPIVSREYGKARQQVGTLGGGNHFIEVQKGSDGHIWIMIHSGSRNIGKMVADHYNKTAVGLNEKWNTGIPRQWSLAYLPLDSKEAQQYLCEMDYCVRFALSNRKVMMQSLRNAFEEVLPAVAWEPMINIAHNFAVLETHYKEQVMVHRKGATQAMEGQTGIIPGSQGTRSYIVRGRGNRESFQSCSHGAGRRMGRKQAIRELELAKEKARLDAQGIIHSLKADRDLDEAPSAYKDIDRVMENQKDLVEILVELNPLAVIKG